MVDAPLRDPVIPLKQPGPPLVPSLRYDLLHLQVAAANI